MLPLAMIVLTSSALAQGTDDASGMPDQGQSATDAPHQETQAQQADEPSYQRRKPSTIFAFGVSQLTELGKYDLYERLYGSKGKMLFFQSGYYLYTYGVDLGISTKVGYYNDKGHPLQSLSDLTVPIEGNLPATAAVDQKQNIELTLIPVQARLELAYSPFPVSRRITLRGWIGPEFTFVQEALRPNLPSTADIPAGTSLVSKGWNQGLVTGAMISVSLNGIEARSDFALRSIGIDRTHLGLFYEVMKTTQDKMGNYDRKEYGINFTFEGLR